MISVVILTLIAGVLAGILAGLFGIGGGLVLVPMMIFLFTQLNVSSNQIMVMSVATSLATIVFTSISSIIAHQKFGAIVWEKVFRLAPGMLIGALSGAGLASLIPNEALRSVFVLYLIYVGIQMALDLKPIFISKSDSSIVDTIAGLLIGMLSSMLGIGGGTLTVPYLVSNGQVMNRAVAISSACGLPIALSGTLAYVYMGFDEASLPKGSIGYIYIPAFIGIVSSSLIFAPVGAKLAHSLPTKKLKRYFSLLLFLVAIKLLFQ